MFKVEDVPQLSAALTTVERDVLTLSVTAEGGHLTALSPPQAAEPERRAAGTAVHRYRVDGAQRPGADGEL